MSDIARLTQRIQENVGHEVTFETGPGNLLSPDHIADVWCVIPTDTLSALAFITWHRTCQRQWYETAEMAADQYCAHWKEWIESAGKNSNKVDYSADSIDFP